MHPALSVIVFTVLSGIGTGLLVWLPINAGLPDFPAVGITRWPADRWFGIAAFGTAFAAIVAGLVSSTFHLGHPERAWRAFSQWRSSWLSREGVMSVALFVPTGLFAIGFVLFERTSGWWLVAGAAGALCCLATTYCTAMIYASLKPIPAWHRPGIAKIYIVLSLASGGAWLLAIARGFDLHFSWADPGFVAATVLALLWKFEYWRRIDAIHAGKDAGLSAQSALGIATGQWTVQPLDAPHTQQNYLMKEMGFVIARRHARKLRRLAVLFGFVLPVALWFLSIWLPELAAAALLFAGAISMTIGLLIERWLFFAEAKHTVMLYYRGDKLLNAADNERQASTL